MSDIKYKKQCPLCKKMVKSLFWHMWYQHTKEDILKAYVMLIQGHLDISTD